VEVAREGIASWRVTDHKAQHFGKQTSPINTNRESRRPQ
jgi:hypothetical protein